MSTRTWSISKHNDCIWMSGASMTSISKVLEQATMLDPEIVLPAGSPRVMFCYKNYRVYYVIYGDNQDEYKLGENLEKWAVNNDMDSYYPHKILPSCLIGLDSETFGIKFLFAMGILFPLFVLSMFSLSGVFISDLMALITFLSSAGALIVFAVVCETFNIYTGDYKALETRTGYVVDTGYQDTNNKRFLRKALLRTLKRNSDKYSKSVLESISTISNHKQRDKRFRIIINEPHPSNTLTNAEAIRYLDGSYKGSITMQETNNEPVNEIKSNVRMINDSALTTRMVFCRNRIRTLADEIRCLERKNFNSNEISQLIDTKISILDNQPLMPESYYDKLLHELESMRTSLSQLANTDSTMQRTLTDLDSVIEFKKALNS